MIDALIICCIFFGIATVVTVPLTVVMLGSLGRSWLRLKERELELRKTSVSAQLREAHFRQLPHYVDADDPEALLAWAKADRELALLAGDPRVPAGEH